MPDTKSFGFPMAASFRKRKNANFLNFHDPKADRSKSD